MHEAEHTASAFGKLRKMGMQLAIDDFGIGYSNLSYLKRFGVDRLKIDQSFVRDITTDNTAAAIVGAITEMARSLKIEVTAEGVETEQQFIYLREHGCSEVQGFLFSRPVSAAEFEQQLKVERRGAFARRLPVAASYCRPLMAYANHRQLPVRWRSVTKPRTACSVPRSDAWAASRTTLASWHAR